MNDHKIVFEHNINHIIKYKRGQAYYFADKLKRGSEYNDKTNKREDAPFLSFFRDTTHQPYTHYFFGNESFSDRFEYVNWDEIDYHTRKEIIKANPGLGRQVNSTYNYFYDPKKQISSETINNYILALQENIQKQKYYVGRGENQKDQAIYKAYEQPKDDGRGLINFFNLDGSSFNIKGLRPENHINSIDMSNYLDMCRQGINIHNTSPVNAISNFNGMNFEPYSPKIEENGRVEPIILKNKKKKKKMVMLKVSKPIILK